MSLGMPEALTIFGVCGTIATAIVKFVPSRKGPPDDYVTKDLCKLNHTWTNEALARIEGKIDTLIGSKK